jgi:hypothetical protein
VLRVLQELPRVPQQYLKKLEGTDDLWEVRAELGGDALQSALHGVMDYSSFIPQSLKSTMGKICVSVRKMRCHLTRFLPVSVDVEMPGEISVHFGFREADDFRREFDKR